MLPSTSTLCASVHETYTEVVLSFVYCKHIRKELLVYLHESFPIIIIATIDIAPIMKRTQAHDNHNGKNNRLHVNVESGSKQLSFMNTFRSR